MQKGFNAWYRTSWVSGYQKDKTSLDLMMQEVMGFWDGSGTSWTICKMLIAEVIGEIFIMLLMNFFGRKTISKRLKTS